MNPRIAPYQFMRFDVLQTCYKCGGSEFTKAGWQVYANARNQRLHCIKCGAVKTIDEYTNLLGQTEAV